MSLHYAALPFEFIFAANNEEIREEIIEINFPDMRLIVQPMSVNRFKIVRLISTNPQVYLNPALAPGQYLTLSLASGETSREL